MIEKKEFIAATLDLDYGVFIVYVATLNIRPEGKIYLLKRAQIAYLKVDETFTKVFNNYLDLKDIFLSKLASKLLDYMDINDYTIELIDD